MNIATFLTKAIIPFAAIAVGLLAINFIYTTALGSINHILGS